MVTEDYVSFETAKLLKEKGFNEICHLGYNKNGEYVPTGNRTNSQIIQPDFCFICCPTLQMAQKWFREEKHLAINPSTFYRKLEGHEFHNWGCNIVNLDTWELYCSNPLETFPADTYEEALEKAMKYALEKFV